MQALMNVSPSFKGTLNVKTFTKAGEIESDSTVVTTLIQDRLIKRVSMTMAPENGIIKDLTRAVGEEFYTLIEGIIGKPIPKSKQEKMMTNASNVVVCGDCIPKKGGVTIKHTFETLS